MFWQLFTKLMVFLRRRNRKRLQNITTSKPKKTHYTLTRVYYDEATCGKLYDPNNEVVCEILERPWLDNQPYFSCIPEGKYKVGKYSSPRFPDNWEVKDVHYRSYILFHKANYVDEIQGCLAVVSHIFDQNPELSPKVPKERRWRGVDSGKAWDHFKKVMPDDFELVIES